MDNLRRPERLQSSTKRLSMRIILSYLFDYVIIIALAILYSVIDAIVTPFHQHFALQNYTIQYPYAIHERVPIALALVISAGFPILVIALYTLVIDGLFSERRKTQGYKNVYTFGARLWELNCGILGLFLAQGAAFVITGTMKNLVGKPRPDLLDRCQPRDFAQAAIGLSNITICTQTNQAILTDGFRSFPSGHSSSSFAGLFYLSLYLAGKLHVLDQRGEVWRTVIVLIPTLGASCIAISRIMDARHHPFDVLFGSAMGILVAWGSYRQYFPAVGDAWEKGRAYPIRSWGKGEESRAPNASEGIAMEPLRRPENQPGLARQASLQAASGNVFRDQVSHSQRQRRRDQEWSEPSSFDEERPAEETGYRDPAPQALSGQGSMR